MQSLTEQPQNGTNGSTRRPYKGGDWGDFEVTEGQLGGGSDLVVGRGVTLDDAVSKTYRTMRHELAEGFRCDPRLIWNDGELLAIVMAPETPGRAFWIAFTGVAESNDVEIDAACDRVRDARRRLAAAWAARRAFDASFPRGHEWTETEQAAANRHSEEIRDARSAREEALRLAAREGHKALGITFAGDYGDDGPPPWEPFVVETNRYILLIEPHDRGPGDEDYDFSDVDVRVICRASTVMLQTPPAG